MDQYMLALITGVSILAICAIAFVVFFLLFRKEREKWEQYAEAKYAQGKEEANNIIRNTIDQIEEDKTRLLQLSDRELLVEIMLALGSQGRRLDRVEDKTKCIVDYQKYINDMNTLSHKLSLGFVALENNISLTDSSITNLRQTIQGASSDISRLIDALGDLKKLLSEFEHHTNRIKRIEQQIRVFEEEITTVMDEMEKVMSQNNQSPMAKLWKIEEKVESLATNIASLDDTLDDLSRKTTGIEENLGDYNDWRYGNSLHARISRIDEIIENINESVDETLKHSGRNSLISKMESISSDLWYLRNNLDS